MNRLNLILLTVLLTGLSFASSAMAGANHIEYMKQYQAQKDTAAAPAPTEEGSQFWHRSKYLREQTPGTGTQVDTTNKPGQKYDRPDWAPK